jgi:hypothetical protein
MARKKLVSERHGSVSRLKRDNARSVGEAIFRR